MFSLSIDKFRQRLPKYSSSRWFHEEKCFWFSFHKKGVARPPKGDRTGRKLQKISFEAFQNENNKVCAWGAFVRVSYVTWKLFFRDFRKLSAFGITSLIIPNKTRRESSPRAQKSQKFQRIRERKFLFSPQQTHSCIERRWKRKQHKTKNERGGGWGTTQKAGDVRGSESVQFLANDKKVARSVFLHFFGLIIFYLFLWFVFHCFSVFFSRFSSFFAFIIISQS